MSRKDLPARPHGGLHAAGLRDPHPARDRARRADRVPGDRGRRRAGRAHRRARAGRARRAHGAARRGQHGRRGGPVVARHLLRQALARDLRPLRRRRARARQGRDLERRRRLRRPGAHVPLQPAARARPEVPGVRQPAAVLRRAVPGRAHHAHARGRPALEEQGGGRAPRRRRGRGRGRVSRRALPRALPMAGRRRRRAQRGAREARREGRRVGAVGGPVVHHRHQDVALGRGGAQGLPRQPAQRGRRDLVPPDGRRHLAHRLAGVAVRGTRARDRAGAA